MKLKLDKFIVITCPKCFTVHQLPVPADLEKYGGCMVKCGCGKDMTLLENFEPWNEHEHGNLIEN